MASVIKQESFSAGGTYPQPIEFNVEDVQARAAETLTEAEGQAQSILAEARREAARLLVEAKQQGLEQANQAFEKRVQEAAQQISDSRCKTAIAACEQAVQQVAESTSEWLAVWRNQTVTLAAKIAEKLLRREMQDQDEVLRVWLEEALVAMRDARDLRVVVHPDDFSVAGRFLQQLAKSIPQAAEAQIIPDPEISLGGCIVRNNNGLIDQQLETQLQRLVEQLNA